MIPAYTILQYTIISILRNTGLGGATGGPVGGGVQTPADAETRWAEQLRSFYKRVFISNM